jgi:DNA gyrase inhibitor GyrI
MSDLEVRIIRLEPLHVAMAYGFGVEPESIAWEKLLAFFRATGLDKDQQSHRFFGFNNPNPSPGSPKYGYEQWVTVGSDVKGDGDVRIKDFSGGLYAVTRCQLAQISEVWKQLVAWREKSRYHHARHQWLEEVITDPLERPVDGDSEFDIYLPITQ